MKLSEVKTSIVVALMKSVTTQNEKKAINVSKDVERQIEIVGKFLEKKFLLECLTTAENCLNDPKKCFELKALDTIYKAMKWAETNQDTELAVKYANLYITNKKRLKK